MAVTKKESTEKYGVQLIRGKRYMCNGKLYQAGKVYAVVLEVLRELLASKEKYSKRPYFKIVLREGQVMPNVSMPVKAVVAAAEEEEIWDDVVADNTDEEGYEI